MARSNVVQTPVKSHFKVLADSAHGRRINGRRREPGDIVELTEEEARFLLLDGSIEPAPAPLSHEAAH